MIAAVVVILLEQPNCTQMGLATEQNFVRPFPNADANQRYGLLPMITICSSTGQLWGDNKAQLKAQP